MMGLFLPPRHRCFFISMQRMTGCRSRSEPRSGQQPTLA